jgi:hypothetical protein
MRKRLDLIWVAICLVLLSCHRPTSDEETILELINGGARLAEEHDLKGLMKLTTEDFLVEPGGYDREETKKMILWAFMHYRDFRILYPSPQMDLESGDVDEASVRVPFLIVKKGQSFPNLKELYDDPKSWLQEVGEQADLYRVQLTLTKYDGEWLVRRAHLEGFTGLGFGD